MSTLLKIKLSRVLSSFTFWTVIIVLLLQSKGFEVTEVFQLMSIYSIFIIVLEYPTGVIGDYFSHKASTIIGYFLMSLGLFLMSTGGSYLYYLIVMFIIAVAFTLSSGSDVALLHSISTDFKKDYADIKMYSLLGRSIAITAGGFLGSINLALPFYFTSAFLFLAGMILLLSKTDNKKDDTDANIFKTAGAGVREVVKNSRLLNLMIFASLLAGFFISYKWVFNSLFIEIQIDVKMWGIIIGFATILDAFGSKIYGKIKDVSLTSSFIAVILSMIITGLTSQPILSIIGLILMFFFRGVIETQLTVLINANISGNSRAGILSLQSLISRLVSSLYLLLVGYFLDLYSVSWLMYVSAAIMFVLGITIIILIGRIKVQRSDHIT